MCGCFRYFVAMAAALIALSLPQCVRAALNGLEPIGHSYQSDARGGIEVAVGDTALALVRQPASLCLHPKGRFDSKITMIYPINRWQSLTGVSFSQKPVLLSYNLAYVRPIKGKLHGGVAFEKSGWGAKFDSRYIMLPGKVRTSSNFTKYSITCNFAYRLTNRWFVGAGPYLAIASTNSSVVLGSGLASFGKMSATGAGFQIGTLFKPTARSYVGLSYRSPAWVPPSSKANYRYVYNNFGTDLGVINAQAHLAASTQPQRISFGSSYLPTEKLRVGWEAGWIGYASSGLGRSRFIGGFNNTYPVGFRNLWLVNSGFDYDFNDHFSGSAGYSWNTNPMSPKALTPTLASNTQNMFTWGLRYKYKRVWTGFAHIISLPSISRANGTTDIPGGIDYRYTSIRQVLQSLNVGVGFNF